MKYMYMDLLRNRTITETYYYTVVLLVKRNTLISYLYFYAPEASARRGHRAFGLSVRAYNRTSVRRPG